MYSFSGLVLRFSSWTQRHTVCHKRTGDFRFLSNTSGDWVPTLWGQYILGKLSREEMDCRSPGGEGGETLWEAVVKILQDECVISSLNSTQKPHTNGKLGDSRARA